MKRSDLIQQIRRKQSYLCTGLDTEMGKLPAHLPRTGAGLLEFNRQIVQATAPSSVAWKINTAFYEQYGPQGWEWMQETLAMLPTDTLRIADAKRGDIGNTSTMYARAFFEAMDFDAVTVAPYMGEDSLRPFLEFENKWIICLALTSNPGHRDFQLQEYNGKKLYETVIETVCKWGNPDNLMFVVGATRAEYIAQIRTLIPEHFLLVPGVGAQGGNLQETSKAGLNADCGLLVNSSRGIIYASSGEDFSEAAGREALAIQQEMAACLQATTP
ncbi:MAG: orotidine-5'-phosphate decarboxylase [Bacteroidetes bacterium]|nr:orotidine-5'-phosphate decarboxylase [Bacteroidota bacterium]